MIHNLIEESELIEVYDAV